MCHSECQLTFISVKAKKKFTCFFSVEIDNLKHSPALTYETFKTKLTVLCYQLKYKFSTRFNPFAMFVNIICYQLMPLTFTNSRRTQNNITFHVIALIYALKFNHISLTSVSYRSITLCVTSTH